MVTGTPPSPTLAFKLTIPAAELAERYKREGMLAYVELIQRREKELGVDVLTHQKWYVGWSNICFLTLKTHRRSGAPYIDRVLSSEFTYLSKEG
jgi:hypothetical protein